MKLKKILIELSVDDALKLLDLNKSAIGNMDVLKTAFRKASMTAHPDRGGSDEQFRNVKDAFDLLSKQSSNVNNRFDWNAIREKYNKVGSVVLEKLNTEFNINAFIEHLSRIFNTKFEHKSQRSKITNDSYSVVFDHEFYNDTRDMVFEVDMYVNLQNVVHNKGGLVDGNTNISYPLGISTSVLFNGKKVKITQSNYNQTQNHDVLSNPELVLPKSKLLKFETTSSTKKFRKADMFQILTKKYSADVNGDTVYKKFEQLKPDRVILQFNRGTFMKMPYWTFTLFNNGKSDRLPYKTFDETPETAELFGKLITFGLKANTIDDIIEYIKKLI